MTLIKRIRNSYITKGLALTLAFNLLAEIIAPTAAMALTSGPSQPEFQSFEPVETTDMVNLFTGDFTYNIPLMNVPGPNGGYPINLAYHASPSMDEEASWVGLGWSLNAGAINRQVRGVPDDFNGDSITTKMDMKENWTVGLGVSPCMEVFGADFCKKGGATGILPTVNLNFRYNSYRGFGYSLDPSISLIGENMTYRVGLSLDSDDGIGVNARIGLPTENVNNETNVKQFMVNHFLGAGFNSRSGLQVSYDQQTHEWWTKRKTAFIKQTDQGEKVFFEESAITLNQAENRSNPGIISFFKVVNGESTSASSCVSFTNNQFYPSIGIPKNSYRLNVNIGLGNDYLGFMPKGYYGGNFDIQKLQNKNSEVQNKAYGYENLYDNSSEKKVLMDFSRTNQGDVKKTTSNLAIPQITYDVYGIMGQGIGGGFRPNRNETGRIFDPNVISFTAGGYFHADGGLNKVGWGTGGTVGYSEQQAWDNHHDLDALKFSERKTLKELRALDDTQNSIKSESIIYKVTGEKATMNTDELDYIGGESVAESYITGTGTVWNYGVKMKNTEDPLLPDITRERNVTERRGRNNLVHKVTNDEIIGFHPDQAELRPGYAGSYLDQSFMGEFEIFYYKWGDMDQSDNPTEYLDRNTRGGHSIGHHNGGYKVLDNTGSYYVYGLPVYNTKQVEKVFSVNATLDNGSGDPIYENKQSFIPFETETVDGVEEVIYKHANTQKLYNKKETPAYATSYLLTSILGADYVDLDGNGPDDGDHGHWVKMDYVHYTEDSPYKWRAPYKGAMYSAGSAANLEDDVASYQYGEKELWYLARIETETHIAIFELEEDRTDNYESMGEFTNLDAGSPGGSEMKSGLRLSKIRLYEKRHYSEVADPENAIPIQTVHFEYEDTDQLCKNADNHSDGSGKLTLKKVYMTYGGNSRGALNAYEFTYSENNPDYSFERYDRWGKYKGEPSTVGSLVTNEINQELPYTGQYQQGPWGYEPDGVTETPLTSSNQTAFQEQQNENASAWSLSDIKLPSGGNIHVDYEKDDYAYIQNHRVTQMTYITKVNDNTTNENELYRWKGSPTENDFNDPTQRRIYFKLEKPIPVGTLSAEELADRVYEDYVEGIRKDENGDRNLYFRSFMKLKGVAHDYVSGYLPLEENVELTWLDKDGEAGTPAFAYGATSVDDIDGDKYTEGFVTIKKMHKKNDPSKAPYDDFHPMALAAWQYMRINTPQILMDAGDFESDEFADTDKGKAKKVKNLFSFIPEMAKMFTGYRRYCYNRELARFIVLNKSMIRLTTPDRKKYGGGSRVKQIELTDNWDTFEDTENSESYGVVYDYTKTDPETGETYSSGVAQYEPMIGGDEIALRYPKYYPGKIPFFTDNNLFFEHPVNESYMPAPVVGYSKVTVRSLNTANQMNQADLMTLSDEEEGRGVAGAKVYEFYTAREFPVLVDETPMGTENNTIKSFNVPIIIPFIAQYRRNKIAATQGYKIELNDMHGKLKSTASYGVDQNFDLLSEPISKTTYKYNSKEISGGKSENNSVYQLNNLVNTVKKVSEGGFVQEEKYVGLDYDFFTDQRHNKSALLSVGLNSNIDIVNIPLTSIIVTIPSFWPHLSSSKNDVRTLVSNKIIRKSGLLEEVISVSDGYTTSMKTEAYDPESGRALLTKTTNAFDEEVYSLSHPAHWEYEGMEHAYQNINMEFYAELDRISSDALFGGAVPPTIVGYLQPGDVFIAHIRPLGSTDEDAWQNFKATFISKNHEGGMNDVIIHVDNATYSTSGTASPFDGGLEGYFKVYRSGHRNHYMTDAGSISSKVNPIDNANYTTTTETYHAVTGETASPSGETITMNIKSLDEKVLSANAITFRDNWEVEQGGHENPYNYGQAGIWRSVKSYVYAGERSQSTDGGVKSPRVKDDGVMSDVPYFNWQVTDYERFQSDWQWSGEVTRMNKYGYETENKDRLGIYSSALYGYSQSFPIGVGGNATYSEIATQDFEQFETEAVIAPASDLATRLEGETNFFFHTDPAASGTRSVEHSDRFKILGGKVGAENFVILEGEYDGTYWSGVSNIDLAVQTSNNSGKQSYRVLRANVVSAAAATAPGCIVCPYTKVTVEFEHETISPSETAGYLPDASHLGGMATVYRTKNVNVLNADGSTTLSVVEGGHTGEQSLKIANGAAGFVHGELELIPGKRYVLSYWLKRDNSNVFDYNVEDSALEIYVEGTTTDIIISSETKSSRVIEGWQKIDVEFEIDPGTYSANQSIETKFFSGASAFYIDDIRLAPKTGGIMTYVYDTENYRLKATLNGNNYATFYYYSDQGNLYLTKQETEEGIVSSGGSRGYSRPQITE